MPDASYDIVIVGMDLPGLALGALCARKGYTVLVVGQGSLPGEYPYKKIPLLRRPPLTYGFSTSPAMRAVFQDVGLTAEMRNRPVPLEPSLQLITPGKRLEISQGVDSLLTELKREFPKDAQGIFDFWNKAAPVDARLGDFLMDMPLLPAQGFFGRRRFRKSLAREENQGLVEDRLNFPGNLGFSAPLSAALYQMTSMHSSPLPALAVRRMLQHLSHGLFDFPGGETGLARLFIERIQTSSGQVWPERFVRRLQMKGKNVRELLVELPQKTVRPRVVVVNTNPRRVLSLIPQENQIAAFHGSVLSQKPKWYRYVVNFILPEEALPGPLARHTVLVMDPRQEMETENALWLVTRRPNADGEPAVVSAFCRIPAERMPTSLQGFQELNLRLRQSVEWLLPFLPERLKEAHTPYLALQKETGQWKPDPAEFQELYAEPLEGTVGLSAIPAHTPYKNVLLLGDSYLGALGLEGAFLGARRSFEWIQETVVLKQVLRK